jgi:alkanesulfonate monooxygenase SsuD/methylene tetrahydromethanopterin reductase-like flavin-dependent oxidoreductase (luciferase family)
LIKAVTTLDVLSAGRAWLGSGAGYNGDEARAMGLFLPETAERFARMSDLLRLARHMWNGDETPFRGEYLDLEHPVGSPRPVTTPRPPVLLGGTDERRTLRLVAEYGDACDLFDVTDGGAAIRRQLAVLDRHCADVGRPAAEIERTVTTALESGASADWLAERCRALADFGAQHVVVIAPRQGVHRKGSRHSGGRRGSGHRLSARDRDASGVGGRLGYRCPARRRR